MYGMALLYAVMQSIAPAAHVATVTGAVVDLANANADMIEITAGTITDGTHTPTLQSGTLANGSDMANCTVGVDQTIALAALTTDSTQLTSYIGPNRYVRVVVTVAGATTGGVYGANVITKERTQN